MCRNHKIFLLIITLSFFWSFMVFALPTDSEQTLHVVADSSLVDYKKGTSTYEGNVKVTQGTSKVIADRLITNNNANHKIEEAIAYGIKELAEYITITKVGDPEFHAKAKIIKFYPAKSLVILEGDVDVIQGENNFHGPLIIYNIKDQIVTAPASKSGRATLVIEPDKLKL